MNAMPMGAPLARGSPTCARGATLRPWRAGNLLLGMCEPSRVQVATIHRAPLEAYVTLSAHGSAAAACTESMAVHRGFKRVCGEVRKANGSPIMRIF